MARSRSARADLLRCTLLVLAALAAWAGSAAAAPAVFNGDPKTAAPARVPYTILPGAPLLLPGPDGLWGTGDDIIKPKKVGDVDVVVRTGAAAASAPADGAAIPPGASSLAAAPTVTAGGLDSGVGTQLPYRFLISAGALPPAVGAFLGSSDLDGRGTLAMAFADLDGDGFIGPTPLADDAIKRQETLTLVGRRLALITGGTASDGLAVSVGLPASVGGLGLVIAGGAATGSTPYLYKDGPWISTLLPCVWPLDPNHIIGGETLDPPDPVGLVDLELSGGDLYCPAPNNPVFGTPFAIPLDGSSTTTDLARAVSGPEVGVAFAQPVDRASFAPSLTARVQPIVGTHGERLVASPLASLDVQDDGPGHGATILVYPADLLGNAADPAPGGLTVELAVGPALRIAAPDRDGDPQRETIHFDGPDAIAVVLDDAGEAGAGGVKDQLVATAAGAVAGTLRVEVVAPGVAPPPGPLGQIGRSQLLFAANPGRDRLLLDARIAGAPAALDPTARDVTITLRAGGGIFYTRTIPAGSFAADGTGFGFAYADAPSTPVGRIASVTIARDPARPRKHRVQLDVRRLELGALDPTVGSITATIAIGATTFSGPLSCTYDAGASTTTCVP